jgi:hypothetical protein
MPHFRGLAENPNDDDDDDDDDDHENSLFVLWHLLGEFSLL